MGGKNVAPPGKGGKSQVQGGKIYSGKSAVASNGGGMDMGGGMGAGPKKFTGSSNVSNAQVAELEG